MPERGEEPVDRVLVFAGDHIGRHVFGIGADGVQLEEELRGQRYVGRCEQRCAEQLPLGALDVEFEHVESLVSEPAHHVAE